MNKIVNIKWIEVSDPYNDTATVIAYKKNNILVRVKYLKHIDRYFIRVDDLRTNNFIFAKNTSKNKYKKDILEIIRTFKFDE